MGAVGSPPTPPNGRAAGLPLDSGPAAPPRPAVFHARPDRAALATMDDVREALAAGEPPIKIKGFSLAKAALAAGAAPAW